MRRILIANRGEIALRVLRACRDAGLTPLMVFSEADRDSLPVRLADDARLIGPPPAASSYLDIEAILKAARTMRADAIHPGYGFLSENPEFAEACEAQGLVFIGPPPAAMRAMGDKVEARRLMAARGVPVIPGLTERATGPAGAAAIRAFADQAGYPILLKAAAGGGGKGMRVVRAPGELGAALRAARSEAKASFGDDGIYAEKYLEKVRHVEIQVLADRHGQAVHLGERECSLQRRHQKLIEESPSTAVTPETRERLGALALEAVRASGYFSAGTVEFLLDDTGHPYFMEVNARLQVEHPVTEMTTGYDLVREQIDIARGKRLSIRQETIRRRGWAIECRILAEDPAHGFRPCPGRIAELRLPAGPGIRVDTALLPGDEVSLYYDALIAKLIAWGRTRGQAIARMRRALDEFVVAGIETTIPFHREVMNDPGFRNGAIDIGYVDRELPRLIAPLLEPGPDLDEAVIAAAIVANEESPRASASMSGSASEPGAVASPWLLAGRRALMQGRRFDRPRREVTPK